MDEENLKKEVTETNSEEENQNVVQEEEKSQEEDKNWKATRAKLKELEKENAKFREAQKKKEEEELRAKGEYEKLLEQREAEIQEMKQKAINANISRSIQTALIQKNLNPNAIELLENKAIQLATTDEDGNVTNLDEIVNVLSNNYSFLFQDPKSIKVIPSTPSGNSNKQMLTTEQWQELDTLEKDKAIREGRYTF